MAEQRAPDGMCYIQSATGDRDMHLREVIQLTTISVQGAESTDFHTLFNGLMNHGVEEGCPSTARRRLDPPWRLTRRKDKSSSLANIIFHTAMLLT